MGGAGGYDIGASFSGSSSASASNSGSQSVKGGGVTFNISDQGSTASGSSTQKSLYTLLAVFAGIALLGFVIWRVK